jgi:hypothetical protein
MGKDLNDVRGTWVDFWGTFVDNIKDFIDCRDYGKGLKRRKRDCRQQLMDCGDFEGLFQHGKDFNEDRGTLVTKRDFWGQRTLYKESPVKGV